MGFVIRAEGVSDKRVWVSVRLSDGSRTLSARHIAAVFATPTEAQAAIKDLPKRRSSRSQSSRTQTDLSSSGSRLKSVSVALKRATKKV
jgi:hypothetical protein